MFQGLNIEQITIYYCHRYVKGEDVDNWVSINEQTAEIKLNKYPDRESGFLVNGTYYAKVLCITNGKLTSDASCSMVGLAG